MNNFVYSKSSMVNITQLNTLNRLTDNQSGELLLDSRHISHNRYLKATKHSKKMKENTILTKQSTVHTQTPQTQISYEFDKALYHFKKSVQSHKEQSYSFRSERLYLPTIIDTTPRPRRFRTELHPGLPLPICTCKHRPQQKPPENQLSPDKANRRKELKPVKPAKPRQRPDSPGLNMYQSTPVLAVAIRRNGFDKTPIVTFNGIAGYSNVSQFKPFVKDISTQTTKSYVHVEFELNNNDSSN